MNAITIKSALKDFQEKNPLIYQIIEYGKTFYQSYPEKPKKPLPPKNGTPKEIREFADEVEEYEQKVKEYQKLKIAAQEYNKEVEAVIIEFMKEETGFNNIVPEQYKDKVFAKAWDRGCSNGLYEVYLQLNSFVEIFEI